jgi:hypothetical protein
MAAIAASFGVAYVPEARGDGDDVPDACDWCCVVLVCPQAVSSNNEDNPNALSNLEAGMAPQC